MLASSLKKKSSNPSHLRPVLPIVSEEVPGKVEEDKKTSSLELI
jgi:hypothetical protein